MWSPEEPRVENDLVGILGNILQLYANILERDSQHKVCILEQIRFN